MRLMRNRLSGAGLFLLLALPSQAAPQANVLSSGVVTWEDGFVIRYQTSTNFPLNDADLEGWTVGEVIGKDRISRYFVDGHKGIYFGYDLVIEHIERVQRVPTDRFRPFRVKVQPLSLKRETVRGHYTGPEPTLMPLISYPEAQMAGDGDVLNFDLTPRHGRGPFRLSESIRFTWHHPRLMPISRL